MMGPSMKHEPAIITPGGVSVDPITGDRSQNTEPSAPPDASAAATHTMTDTGYRFNDIDAVRQEQAAGANARISKDSSIDRGISN